MSPISAQALRQVAEEAARQAGQVLLRRLDQTRTVATKATSIDLVTDADRASEEVLLRVLGAHFPDHSVLAEESGASGQGPYRWFIDPLDGTTNYAHRVPHFCVSVGVEGPVAEGEDPSDQSARRRLFAGAVFDPLRNELFSAAAGQGATLNGRPLSVTQVSSVERALLGTGFSSSLQLDPDGPVGLFNHLVKRAQGVRQLGSAALDLAYVACGRLDGFFEMRLQPWDLAAGALLVLEAGGVVARLDAAAPWTVERGDVLAAGPLLHPTLAAEVRSALGELGPGEVDLRGCSPERK